MHAKTVIRTVGVMLAVLSFSPGVWAQAQAPADPAQTPPEILSADVARRQKVEANRMEVSFAIVDTDKVTEVRINGKAQKFEPADTVLITTVLQLKEGRNRVVVEAVDERGNRRSRTFVLGLGDVELDVAPPKKLEWGVAVQLRYEQDDNPTNDLLSITVDDTEISGVVKDSEQPDTRTVLQALLSLSYGDRLSGFGGVRDLQYAKAENDVLNVQLLFAGVQYKLYRTDTADFRVGYNLADINIGGADYAVTHQVSPSYNTRRIGSDGLTRHQFGLDFTQKDFAAGNAADGSQYTLKWVYRNIDAERLDAFRSVLSTGNSTEGFETSDYDFYNMDFDWYNRWEVGFRFDIGFGYQYRNYPNEKDILFSDLGDTRVDHILRLSYGLGWQFTPGWSAMFESRNVLDLSNKQPYQRTIQGLVVDGTF